MNIIKCISYVVFLLTFSHANAADGDLSAIDSRFLGSWKGSWLEGMSSGKVTLEVRELSADLSFTARPAFGTQSAAIAKIVGNEKQLGFQMVGADGHVMRFDLKPSKDYQKLKGKAFYDNLHMELELSRAPNK